jgi:hypothetical protein
MNIQVVVLLLGLALSFPKVGPAADASCDAEEVGPRAFDGRSVRAFLLNFPDVRHRGTEWKSNRPTNPEAREELEREGLAEMRKTRREYPPRCAAKMNIICPGLSLLADDEARHESHRLGGAR